jgi:abhydrolase domain-containing protein 6
MDLSLRFEISEKGFEISEKNMPNLATMLVGFERFASGLHRGKVQVGDHEVFYSGGGHGDETVVMVHGFSASADNWNRMAARIGKRYRVIAPDLPGWGESTRTESSSYCYPVQVERLHGFIQCLGLRRFHLMGHSMGGGISSRYAAQYPDEVISLTLIAPHGMAEPEPSDLAQSVARGDNWLVPTTVAGVDRLLDKCFGKRPFIPAPVVKYLAQQVISRSEKTGKIFDEIQLNDPPLAEKLEHIKAPTLIIWGDQDRLIHVSAAPLFKSGIRNSEMLILPGTGHMPLMENSRLCVETWLKFIKKPGIAAEAAA